MLGFVYCLMVLWLFCFHCITSSVSLTGSYSEDEPKFNSYILWSQEFNLGHNDRTVSPLSPHSKPPNCMAILHLYLKEIQKAPQPKNDTKNLYIYYLFILFKQNLLQRPRLFQNLLQRPGLLQNLLQRLRLLQNLLQRSKLLKSHNPSSPCYCQFLEILGQGRPLQQRSHSLIKYVMFVVGKFGIK